MKVWTLAALGALLAAGLTPARALACGVSASGVASCSLAEHEDATRPHWAVGLSGLYTATRLRFSSSVRADQTRYAAVSSIAYLPSERLVLQAGLGTAFGGQLVVGDQTYDFSPGPLASLGVDYLAFDDGHVFALLTSSLSFAASRTHLGNEPSVGYQAFDLRLGGQLGVQVARALRPYALVRVFGGPVFWRYQGSAVTGTDTHHYQVGAGLALRLSKRFNALVEGAPLGERAVSIGLGAAF